MTADYCKLYYIVFLIVANTPDMVLLTEQINCQASGKWYNDQQLNAYIIFYSYQEITRKLIHMKCTMIFTQSFPQVCINNPVLYYYKIWRVWDI